MPPSRLALHPLHERDPLISTDRQYSDLAGVYEHLTPEPLRTPAGNVEVFAPFFDVPPGARVLDCACGIGLLAIGLAQAGYHTEASDLSPAMVERTRELAQQHGVELQARVCDWLDLEPGPRYDAVFCVGNSLGHVRDRRCLAARDRGHAELPAASC